MDRRALSPVAVLGLAGLAAALWHSQLPFLLVRWIAVGLRTGAEIFPDPTRFPAALTRLRTLGEAVALCLVCWSTGRVVLRAVRLQSASALESGTLAFVAGAVLWGQAILLLGLAGLLNPVLLRIVGALALAAGVGDCVRRPPRAALLSQEIRASGWPWLVITGIHLLVLSPYAFVPETFYDALEYHLGLPSLHLLRGRINPVPDNAFAGSPSIPAMLYAWLLSLDRLGRSAHLLNFAFLAATVGALLALARRLRRPECGGPAAALFVIAPCVAAMSHRTGVETAGALFFTSALLAVLAASESDERAPWVLAGGLVGAAMATKYLAWALPIAVLLAARARRGAPLGRPALWSAAAAAIVIGPWIAKNLAFYGNPFYPFFHELIRPQAEVMPGWKYLGAAGLPWSSGPVAVLVAFLKAPISALRYEMNAVQYASPVLYGLIPAGLLASRGEREFRSVAVFAAAAWLPLALASDMPRYLIPVYPAFSLLAALALAPGGRALRAAAGASLVMQMAAIWLGVLPHVHLKLFTGRIAERDYLFHENEVYYPTPLFAAAEWLDQNAPQGARVLVFGDARGFHLTRDHILSTPGQATILERWANTSRDAAELRARFEAERITHVLVNHGEIIRQNMALAFTPAGKAVLDAFWSCCTRKAFQSGPAAARHSDGSKHIDRWVVVYEILSENEAAKPHAADNLFDAYKVESKR